MELVKTEPLKTEYRCLFSLYQETGSAGQRERIMPGVDFNVLRTEITMEQVLNQLGFQPTNRSGNQLHGPCPVHGSTSSGSRTFSANLDSGRYYCRKCQSHGNQLEPWAAVNKLPMYEAAIDLCRVLGREVP
jgi:DNA primase